MARFILLFISSILLISNCFGISRWDVFSTKTNYRWSHSPSVGTDELYSFTAGSKTCEAVHISMISRHGARWPSEDDMEDIEEIHKKLVEEKAKAAYPALDSWTSRYDESNEDQLTTEGKREQQELGARTGLRFKTLFDNNGQYVKFVSSSKSDTKDSNEHFHRGLSSVVRSITQYNNQVNDKLVRPYDDCDDYEEKVKSDENMKEFKEFSKSPVVKSIEGSIQGKLNMSDDDLSDEDISIINELCAHEKAIFNEESVWCSLLSDQERLVLEYRSDLENYYKASYGNKVNSRISCPLLRDILHTMQNALNFTWDYKNIGNHASHGYLAGKFYNGHAETILPLLTSLELFKDSEALLAKNMDTMANREFKTSSISPTSANVAFVLYACDEFNSTDRSFMVRLLVNEQPVSIPACRNDECTYDTVRQYYSDLINNCNLRSMCDDDDCDDDDETCAASSMGVSLVLLLQVLIYFKIL